MNIFKIKQFSFHICYYNYSLTWRRKWQPTPVFLPGKSHGWRNLVGYSPWGRKESDTTERLHFHFTSFTGRPLERPNQWRNKWFNLQKKKKLFFNKLFMFTSSIFLPWVVSSFSQLTFVFYWSQWLITNYYH